MGIGPNQPNMSIMNNPMEFMTRFNQFKNNFQGNPQQMVMNMLNNGQMSQEQFNQLQGMANQLLNSFKG